MKTIHLFARRKKKYKVTTDSKHNYPRAPSLLGQNFKVGRQNQVWVSDITYIQTRQGWLYLTVIIDLLNRKIVGWSLRHNLTTTNTIIRAWYMAIKNQPITQELIFYRPATRSDRGRLEGIQYASTSFTNIIDSYKGVIKQSMSRKGNCRGRERLG